MNYDESPSHALTGAQRGPKRTTPRTLRPYSRPSFGGNGVDNGNGSAAGGLLTPSAGSSYTPGRYGGGGLPRSGSESLLSMSVSGIKSMFSRPLKWLSTPSKSPVNANKRDSEASFGVDPEDPVSPSERRASKRSRRTSPTRGPYDPRTAEPINNAFALPALPSHVNLASSASASRRSLSASQSMPYLDPPRSMLQPATPRATATATSGLRNSRALGRSRRMDLSALADGAGEEHDEYEHTPVKSVAGSPSDAWSPWRETRDTSSRAATTRVANNNNALASMSPFRSLGASAGRGLSRSSTLVSHLGREASVASDVSMGDGRGSLRQSSRLRHSVSMRFDRVTEEDDRMGSLPEPRSANSDNSNWLTRSQSVSRATRRSLAAAASGVQLPPVRKGQMVWDAEKGFVRASELQAEAPRLPQQNDAERILCALESMRKTPLIDASAPGLPSALVGSSSRNLRKAIAVPLATSQASENARSKRHGGDWMQDSVSAMISPYGRRKAVEQVARDERRAARRREESEMSEMEVDGASRHSSAHSSRSHSYVSDDHMSQTSQQRSPARRSARLRARSSEPAEETPKATRRSSRTPKAPSKSPEPRRTTRRRQETTPPAENERKASPPASAVPATVPLLTTTAPSPSSSKTDGYQVRDDTEPRARSSLRTATERRHRSHQGAASYNSSRATSPNGGSGAGRFSARDEDLPDMDELESAKIPLTSFKNFSMPLFTPSPAPEPSKTPEVAETTADKSSSADAAAPLLSSRLSVTPAPAPQPASSLSVPSSSVGRTSLSRLGSGLSSRPRASSPLAGSSMVAEPDSPDASKVVGAPAAFTAPSAPPTGQIFSLAAAAPATPSLTPPTGTTTPAGKPPAGAGFFLPPKSDSSMGLSKPSTSAPAAEGGIPNFFGGAATPPVAAAPKAPAFDFGIASKPVEAKQPVVSSFSFGSGSSTPAATSEPAKAAPFSFGAVAAPKESVAPATEGAPFSFGAAPKESVAPATEGAPFSFGAPASKPAEAPKPTAGFSFGGSSSAAASKPAEAPKPTTGFSFGGPSAASTLKPAEAAKPARMSFGNTAAQPDAAPTPFSFGAPKPAEAAPKPAAPFSFGAPAASKPAETTPKPAAPFSFGAPSASKPAEKPADKPAFSFGASSTTAPAANGANGSFGVTAPATTTAGPSTGFGANANAPSSSTPSAMFGQTNGTAPSTGFGFGAAPAPAPAAGPSAGGPFTFGTPATGGFGTSAPAANSSTPSFGFGVAPATSASTGFGVPAAGSTGFGNPPAAASGGFGSGAGFGATGSTSTPSNPSFSFGQTAPAAPSTPTAATTSFSFGASAPAASASTPAAPFTFGAPANGPSGNSAAGPFQFGAASSSSAAVPAVRFGSPAPEAAPAGGNGFSLGVNAADQTPGSPGARKIKPLRRGAVKR